MSLPAPITDLLDYYTDSLSHEIGSLEHRCDEFQRIEEAASATVDNINRLIGGDGVEPEADNAETVSSQAFYRYPEIHAEIRMAFTHVCRAAVGLRTVPTAKFEQFIAAVPEESRASIENLLDMCCEEGGRPAGSEEPDDIWESELSGARKHLLRASMDVRKAQFEITERAVQLAFDRYLKCDIHEVGGGRLIADFERVRGVSHTLYERAKLAEAMGHHEMAAALYRKALKGIDVAAELMSRNTPSLALAEDVHRKRRRGRLVRIVGKTAFSISLGVLGRL